MPNVDKFTVEQVKAALESSGGVRLGAAMQLHCAPNTIKNMIDKHPELKTAEEEIKANNLDIAETQLLKAIREGNLTGVIFYLKTQGKARGYTERHELGGLGGGPINITISPDDEKL